MSNKKLKTKTPLTAIIVFSLLSTIIIISKRHFHWDIPYVQSNLEADSIHLTLFSLSLVLAGFIYSAMTLLSSSCDKKFIKANSINGLISLIKKLMKTDIFMFFSVAIISLINNYALFSLRYYFITLEYCLFIISLIIFIDLILSSFVIMDVLMTPEGSDPSQYEDE